MNTQRRGIDSLLGIAALLTALVCGASARSQEPSRSSLDKASDGSTAQQRSQSTYPDHVRPQADYPQKRRSIVQHYPYPYPGYYHGDDSAGFRNPGHVGRYAEYYPDGDGPSQLEREGVPAAPPVAQFDTNPDTNYQSQMRASQIGIQRYNSIQGHIDNMARPTFGFGFGVGGFGGFW